jgi:selenocysteine-specific elongation factor
VPGTLGVVATAGHVDHGKSALIVALTGIDPDRYAEEKRRGLTIDLGYAWTTLASGREVGVVDVPGHERFIRTMLAGVGPVRLVLFVVAADEGWMPQSEEHLQILDVLGVAGGVIALTKQDLVDDETLALAEADVRDRVAGTVLDGAPIVPVSAHTGEGIEELRSALDELVDDAPPAEDARMRLFVDRVFTVAGAGTVVTGTLTGGCLAVDDDVRIEPAGAPARVRSLQSHKVERDDVCHVARVAANLAGVDRAPLGRGSVVASPGAFAPTSTFDAVLRPVRGVRELPERGAYLLHAGAAESAARLRILERLPDGEILARLRTEDALVLDVHDRVVVWDSGRRRTVGGGAVLDAAPPRTAGDRHVGFLAERRQAKDREAVARLAIDEAVAIRADDLARATGARPEPVPPDGWYLAEALVDAATEALIAFVGAFHAEHPLEEGAPLADVRAVLARAVLEAGGPRRGGVADVLLQRSSDGGRVVRTATIVRLPTHTVALAGHEADLERLLAAIGGDAEATPPTVKELVVSGFDPSLIDAAGRAGIVARLAPQIVVTPALVERGAAIVRAHAAEGCTVSELREALATSRKYAVPLAEWMDAQGITRRVGDLRFPRGD